MQRIPETPPQIMELANSVPRLLWSVMIPTYNCSAYLREAMESVLAQDMGPEVMQISVIDDCSTDADVEDIVNTIGGGRITYYKQPENVGSLRNFETCINQSRGQYIHLLHSDDKVKPGFYKTITALFNEFPEAGAAFCAWDYIDKSGEILKSAKKESDKAGLFKNCIETISKGQISQYVSTVVKREVYEKLGSFYGVRYGEDWIMWARIAAAYPVIYTPQVLAEYREHSTSISGLGILNGENIKDIKKVAQIVSSFLPLPNREEARITICRNYAYWMLDETYLLWIKTRNKRIVYRQLRQLLKGYTDFGVLKIAIKLVSNLVVA